MHSLASTKPEVDVNEKDNERMLSVRVIRRFCGRAALERPPFLGSEYKLGRRSVLSSSCFGKIEDEEVNEVDQSCHGRFRWLCTAGDHKQNAARALERSYSIVGRRDPSKESLDEEAKLNRVSSGGGGGGGGGGGDEGVSAQEVMPALSWATVQRALIGNTIILMMKFGVWAQTGSSALLSEAVHTLADSGNQALLLAGLYQASKVPDKRYQYGYGRAAFFWALVSALGMFWTGAGVTIFHGSYCLFHPEEHAVEMSSSLWGVLAVSFLVDGWVLWTTLKELKTKKPDDVPMWKYLRQVRDPFILAVIMEDFTACTGVIIATMGVGATYLTGNPYWDSLASVGIGGLLGLVALRLVRLNQQYLLGQAIDEETLKGIRKLLYSRPSVDAVYAVQSQWVGPSTFSYKAEVDFDGTFLAAKLEDKYAPLFQTATDREDIEVLMSWYAEDVTRLVEREVRDIEKAIKKQYPQAVFIELEPDSKYSDLEALPFDTSPQSPEFENERKQMLKIDQEMERINEKT